VVVYLYAYESGYYSVTGDLLDASSAVIETYYYSTYFWDGWNDVYLEYSGGAIYANGEDGPYTVELSLYDEFDSLLDTDTHVTAAYAATDFEAPSALFSPPHSDSGYDEDSDGLYEWLSVNVSIEVFVAGWYEVDAYLYDQYSNYLEGTYDYSYLDYGTQTVEILFNSYAINSNAVDGPYTVELYLYGDGWNLLDNDLHTTDAYSYADFEGYGASFDTPFVCEAVDEDSDGLYDYLAVDVPVNVTTPGDYDVEMYLYTDSWDYLAYTYTYATYDSGVTVTTLYFAGEDVFLSSHDGMFIVSADLYDSEWNWVDSHDENVGPYYYSAFVPPAAYFSPTHSDYALDEDSDGLADYIVVDTIVNVTVAGTYLVRGFLYDYWGSYVCYAEAQVDLDVGDEQAVPILFDGWFAWANGEDGAFDVYLVLNSVETGWLDDAWYTTQDYAMADFDPTPPSLESTYTNSPPTADGIYSAGEWDFATAVDLMDADPSNGLAAVMRVANNETLLFVCFDVYGDQYEDGDDSSAISFDTGNDGVATDGAEDQFTIGPDILNEQTHAVYDDGSTDWTVDCTPFQPTWPDHEGLAGAYGFGTSDEYYWYDHRIYEYAIPLALLGIAAGDEIGFVTASVESPGVNDGFWDWSCWPKYFDDMPDLDVYGTLVTALPCPNTAITLDGDAGWDDWWVSDVTVTLEAVGGEGGPDYTMYSVDGGTWQAYDAPFVISGDGIHTLECYSVDIAGNYEPVQTLDVWIDATVPTITHDLDGPTGLLG